MEEIEIEIRLAETNATIRKKKFTNPGSKLLLWITKEQLEAAQRSVQKPEGTTTSTNATRCADCNSNYVLIGTRVMTCAICGSVHRR